MREVRPVRSKLEITWWTSYKWGEHTAGVLLLTALNNT